MFNRVKDWFQKEEVPFEKIGNGHFGGVDYGSNTVQYVNMPMKSATYTATNDFPKLCKTELIALMSCIQFATEGVDVIGLNPSTRQAHTMKSLTDKGYLVRVKKGEYQLSFKK
jgi:hypothetical protein